MGAVRLRQDESTTVQPGEEAPGVLTTFAIAHLGRERESEALGLPHPTGKQAYPRRKSLLRKTVHMMQKAPCEIIHVFKNKANV